MSTIVEILGSDNPAESRLDLNANFAALNLDKVEGPATATDNAIARFDTTTGKLLQEGTISASDVAAGAVTLASIGNNDLVLKTGNATTGSITIADGANGNITIDPDGTGSIIFGAASVKATGTIDFEILSGTGVITFEPNSDNNGSYSIEVDQGDFSVYNDSGNILARFNRLYNVGQYSTGYYFDMEGNGISGLLSLADTSENEFIKFSKVTSAVNELTIANAAAGNAPVLSATGSDTNIGIVLTPKGTGNVVVSTGIELGHATDTTISRVSAGVIAVEGVALASTLMTENAQTGTTYTLVLTDASKLVSMSNAAANTLTVPLNATVAYAVGTRIAVQQRGAGSTTIAATGGVTINVPASAPLAIAEQYGSRVLLKTATNTWQLI